MDHPMIAMLCWDAATVPVGLEQLEGLPGNSTNPATFDFAITYRRIKGANTETVLINPQQTVCNAMISACQELEQDKIRAITTSCGFNAIFQKQLLYAVDIPVFSSALLQIPLIQTMVGSRAIAVLTANSRLLSRAHFQAMNINDLTNVYIYGLEDGSAWQKIFNEPTAETDIKLVAQEIMTKVDELIHDCRPAALVLECTDLPPFAESIRQRHKIPVFDIVTLTNYVYASLS